MACKYYYNNKWYTQEQLLNHPDFKTGSPFLERQYTLNETGERTDSSINLFSAASDDASGIFTKFIQFKETQLYEYKRRLDKIEVAKKKGGLSTDELKRLNNIERELRLQVYGNDSLGRVGLEEEIADLKTSADIDAVGYYVEKDLARLDKLLSTDNIDDLNEAERIVSFYNLAGTFEQGIENPFFSEDEIFLRDEDDKLTAVYRLSDTTMDKFKAWSTEATKSKNQIILRKKEIAVNSVNLDPSVQRTYGDKRFTFDELTKQAFGLKDTDWISMWTMDVTQGIFSHNGIIPQVMFSYLSNSFEKKLKWARDIEEKIDRMKPGVERELIRLKYSLRAGGIIGLKGASYNLFKEITKEGNETGGLIQRFNKEYFDAYSSALNKFKSATSSAKGYIDYTLKAAAYNKAFDEFKKWKRNNTHIFDVTKAPEIAGDTPENQAYRTEMVNLLGESGYKEQLERQQNQLNKYEADRQSTVDTLLLAEEVATEAELSDDAKTRLKHWENNHDPKNGVEDYHSAKGLFVDGRRVNSYMTYNVLVPRRNKVNIGVSGDSFTFTDTADTTGHYSANFETIDKNPILKEYYDVIKEVCQTIKENTPYDLQEGMAANTLPGLKKSFAEIVADKNTGVLHTISLAFRHIMEKVRLSFGVVAQSEVSYATLDPISGQANYRVNDQFLRGNVSAIRQRNTIESARFTQAWNTTVKVKEHKLDRIKRFTVLPLSKMNADTLILLAEYLNVDVPLTDIRAGKIDKIRAITGENVEVGKYIRDFSQHSVVQSQSFDLSKIAKYYSNMAMMYAARQEALPILSIMKQHYQSIEKPRTNNLGKGIHNANHGINEKSGLRTNAIKQMDDWFERVALDNYGGKHHGTVGKVYSDAEKAKIKEIDQILKGETPEETKAKLTEIKSKLGREATATAAFDNFLAWIRTLRLGYNLSSATTNFLEGVTSNMILSASGQYFDPKEIYYGYHVIKGSFVKNLSFGMITTGLAKRNRKLMDKFNVIMDSKNELQKSSVKTYANKFSWMNPHELNQRVEYNNQSPIMIAMLRTEKITGTDGTISSVWDAMDNNGHLKDNFRTEANIENWENLQGGDYLAFKQKLHKAIVLGHGNYHDLRGMMVKTETAGKALMMFKTWIPMQFYWRFATEQDDIQSGQIGYKGRHWSYGKGSAAVAATVMGASIFGMTGLIAGPLLGALYGTKFGKRMTAGLLNTITGGSIDMEKIHVDSGVGVLRETVEATKVLLKKVVGMPVNVLAGRKLIGTGDKGFENFVGKGNFTAQDAQNMRSNMTDIAIQLAWLGLILAVKGMFWDDDDKPEDAERKAHNILVNRLMTLSSQATMYVNPVDTYKSTIQSNATWQYLQELAKEITAIDGYLSGDDIIPTGINAGESKLGNQTTKTFLPGLFKDNIFKLGNGYMFGFESQAAKVFEESPFHKYFRSDGYNDKMDNQRDRAEYRLHLKESLNKADYDDEKAYEKAIKDEVDRLYPTPSKLKKMEMTREEYEAAQKEE